jgi:hypothetical protein
MTLRPRSHPCSHACSHAPRPGEVELNERFLVVRNHDEVQPSVVRVLLARQLAQPHIPEARATDTGSTNIRTSPWAHSRFSRREHVCAVKYGNTCAPSAFCSEPWALLSQARWLRQQHDFAAADVEKVHAPQTNQRESVLDQPTVSLHAIITNRSCKRAETC